MKRKINGIFGIFLCLIMLTGCNLKEFLKDLVNELKSSQVTDDIIGDNGEGCAIYSSMEVLIENEEVELITSPTNLEETFDVVNKSTLMATACYVVNGVQYERIASGFIIKKEHLIDAYKYYFVSSASKLFYRTVNEEETYVDRTPEYVEIVLGTYKRYYAKVEAYYERFDLVVLSFTTADNLYALELGDSDELKIGQTVNSMGTPEMGISVLNTMIRGDISSLNRSAVIGYNGQEISSYTTHQFDAPTNSGMEGGPVFTDDAKVVGITTYKYGDINGFESMSRFIPINDVKNCLNALVNNQEYVLPTIGVQVIELYAVVLEGTVSWTNDISLYEGLYIDSVVLGGRFAKAGGQAHGVMTRAWLNDTEYQIKGSASLFTVLSRCKKGDSFKIEVVYQNGVKEFVLDTND